MPDPVDRRTFLGASDISKAYTGVYGGRYSVVHSKLHGDAEFDPLLAEQGWRWEQPVADAVHALTGLYVHGEQMQVIHPDQPVWRATVDGFLDEQPAIASIDDAGALLEVKTRHPRAESKWDYYRAQVQWQMFVCGKTRALIAVATIGVDDQGDEHVSNLTPTWIERDDYVIGQMVDLADELWELVEAGQLPEPDEHTDIDDVKDANAEADPTSEVDIDDLADLIETREVLKATAKEAADEARKLEALIRHRMGDATEATTTNGRLRVRVGEPVHKFTRVSGEQALAEHPDYSKTVFDVDRFREEHPGLYDKYKQPTSDRRITVKEFTQ